METSPNSLKSILDICEPLKKYDLKKFLKYSPTLRNILAKFDDPFLHYLINQLAQSFLVQSVDQQNVSWID